MFIFPAGILLHKQCHSSDSSADKSARNNPPQLSFPLLKKDSLPLMAGLKHTLYPGSQHATQVTYITLIHFLGPLTQLVAEQAGQGHSDLEGH